MSLALTVTAVNINNITSIDTSIEKIFANYEDAKNFLDKTVHEKFVNSSLYSAWISGLQEDKALSRKDAVEYFSTNYMLNPLIVGMP